ncbi:putative membrane protein [Wickerhamomyces ciferrii]|uniref:Membrane protein n=1 Tax=Wickerhamomyces ciferrii (strain ATCC 14091 / BCRC 22168 / CBS 111 / JCM 3599 / NBRC 0793 / NRRL Y-1031 F-60-10) TaxID=1206466 RepID=K0L0N9_WICCF|nr:uncharacterized protein BN7_6622 [Wickerhamomyces ciferrii]CCH47013.1 putative membrane protein [Wickerhamomyces ciferrii]
MPNFLGRWFNPTIIKEEERVPNFSANTSLNVSEGEKGTKNFTITHTKEQFNDEESLVSNEKQLEHIFKDPKTAEYYRKLYESTNYECKDWFDPDYTWTAKEERKLVWKLDWYVTFWAYFMFTALDFDRSNISQALSDNMLDDLGADVWIPTQLVLWSVVSIAQAGIKGKSGFYATRALIGLFQGGFICDACLWMSYFYTSKELPFRLSLFYIANPLTSVFSSLLAFALLRIKTTLLPHGWQWLFIVEGAFTLIVGLVSYFKMPPSAVQTKTWFRKKGWFTEHEEKIVVNRVLRDDPNKGDMNNRQPVGLKELIKTLLDYDLLPIYIIRILGDIGTSPVSNYMTLTLKKLGFSTLNTNLLTIPYNILTIFTMLIIGYLSEIVKSRALLIGSVSVWILALTFPLRFWPGSQIKVWPTYAILTLLLGHSPIWPLTISWCSANSNSVRTRAVSAAVVNMFSQAGGIISANIYRPDDKPLYKRGNTDLIGIAFGTLAACVIGRQYYIFRNKQKDKIWESFTDEEKEKYILETTDEGQLHFNNPIELCLMGHDIEPIKQFIDFDYLLMLELYYCDTTKHELSHISFRNLISLLISSDDPIHIYNCDFTALRILDVHFISELTLENLEFPLLNNAMLKPSIVHDSDNDNVILRNIKFPKLRYLELTANSCETVNTKAPNLEYLHANIQNELTGSDYSFFNQSSGLFIFRNASEFLENIDTTNLKFLGVRLFAYDQGFEGMMSSLKLCKLEALHIFLSEQYLKTKITFSGHFAQLENFSALQNREMPEDEKERSFLSLNISAPNLKELYLENYSLKILELYNHDLLRHLQISECDIKELVGPQLKSLDTLVLNEKSKILSVEIHAPKLKGFENKLNLDALKNFRLSVGGRLLRNTDSITPEPSDEFNRGTGGSMYVKSSDLKNYDYNYPMSYLHKSIDKFDNEDHCINCDGEIKEFSITAERSECECYYTSGCTFESTFD